MDCSIFDIVGPVMIGPSSSHTAGAARLGKMARYILKEEPLSVHMKLYGSFAKTYKGHGTNKALVAGVLGFEADDPRIPEAFAEAEKAHLAYTFEESPDDMGHPNVVEFQLQGVHGKKCTVVGRSLGGGRIMVTEINGMEIELTGEEFTLMTLHCDQPGIVAKVTELLAEANINISGMRVFRKVKFTDAVMVITTDSVPSDSLIKEIGEIKNVCQVLAFAPL